MDDGRSSGSRSRPRHLYPHQYAKRMSLLSPKGFATDTNGGMDALDAMNARHGPHGVARRFFHSAAVWDPSLKTVMLREAALRVGEPMGMSIPGSRDGRVSVPLRHASEMEEDVEMDADADETWREAENGIAVEV